MSEKKNFFTHRKVYRMLTQPHSWTVDRRLSDFKWLSERLRNEYPQLNVSFSWPQLPIFNGKNKSNIEVYMNSLLNNSDLLKSRFFIFFLSCTNRKKFYDRKDKEFDDTIIKKFKSGFVKIISNEQKIDKKN